VSCDQEDPEDVVAVALQCGPGLVLVVRRRKQLLDRGLLELARRLLAQLFSVGVEQVGPRNSHRGAIRRGRG
jgi:hypothetical protein